MLPAIRKIGLATCLMLAFSLPTALSTPAHAGEFNDAQKKEMGQIVRQYLLDNPEVLRDVFAALEQKEKLAKAQGARDAIKTMAGDIFNAEGDLVIGNPKGDITMVEFFDYNCGFCKRAFPDVVKLIEKDKNLRIVIKEFPILGPGSTVAARAAIASRHQGKYWELHQALVKKRGAVNAAAVFRAAETAGLDVAKLKQDMKAPEVDEILRRNHAVAQALDINGTPAFIIKNKIFPGAVGYDQLAQAVAAARKK